MTVIVSATVSHVSPSPPKTRLWQKGRARSRQTADAAMLEAIAVVGFYHLIAFVANGARVAREPWAARFPSR